MLWKLLTFLSIVWFHIILVSGELSFLSKPWMPVPSIALSRQSGKDFLVNCSTTDPSAVVTLQVRLNNEKLFQDSSVVFVDRIKRQKQNFLLKNLKIGDSGEYSCRATKTNSSSMIPLHLGLLKVKATEKPSIHLYPAQREYKVERGGYANITCEADGLVQSVQHSMLTWKQRDKDGQFRPVAMNRISREEKISVGGHYLDVEVLMFKNFSSAHSGVYHCERRGTYSSLTSPNVTVLLKPDVPLQMTLSGPTSIQEGLPFKLICHVEGVPRPKSISLVKDGFIVKRCTHHLQLNCTYIVDEATYLLHNGVYTCLADNTLQQLSKRFHVVILVAPILRKLSRWQTATYEQNYKLTCDVIKGNPRPVITWDYQLSTCSSDDLACKPLEKLWKTVLKIGPRENTTRFYFVANKTHQDYFYRCRAQNEAGEAETYTFLLRREKKELLFLFYAPNPYIVNKDDSLDVTCATDAHAFKSAVIMRDAVMITNTTTVVNDGGRYVTFSTLSAQLKHSGVYSCRAVLARTDETRTKTLNVTILELVPANIQFTFKSITISQDNTTNFQLHCPAIGNPPPKVSWKFRGNNISSQHEIATKEECGLYKKGIYRLRDVDNVVVICSVDFQKHSGDFECIAENRFTKRNATIKLDIQAKPHITSSLGSVSMSTHADHAIECRAIASPQPLVTWYQHRPSQSHGDKYIAISTSKNVATLNASTWKTSGYGTFTCLASNRLGNDTKEMKITILIIDKVSKQREELTEIIIGVVTAFLLLLIMVLIFMLWYKRKLKTKYGLYLEPNHDFVLDPDRTIFDQSSSLPYDMAWEFPRERLTFVKTLGSGAFGQVWLAEAEGVEELNARNESHEAKRRRNIFQRKHWSPCGRKSKFNYSRKAVAVKTIKDNDDLKQYRDLSSELKILIHIGEHNNIVNLLGACTRKGKLYVILEYCPIGSLLSFLRSKREVYENKWEKLQIDMSKEFTTVDLLKIAVDIGRGMEFLVSKKCVHRDLAARNILVSLDYTMKIGDFGLARDLVNEEFYLNKSTKKLPVKWMAPESLTDKVFNTATDVWSFGIVLWEVFTLGGSPYTGLPSDTLFRFIDNGGRMGCPDHCPIDVYEIMLDCWKRIPFDRPTFSDIVKKLTLILESNSPQSAEYVRLSCDVVKLMSASTNYLRPVTFIRDDDEDVDEDDEHEVDHPLLAGIQSDLHVSTPMITLLDQQPSESTSPLSSLIDNSRETSL